MDFFSVQGEDLSTYSLIDRINLHFKIGASALIPFSIEEKLFVARTDLAETFEEVLQIAQDVYAFSQEHKNEVEIPSTPDESESNANVLQGSDSSSSDKKIMSLVMKINQMQNLNQVEHLLVVILQKLNLRLKRILLTIGMMKMKKKTVQVLKVVMNLLLNVLLMMHQKNFLLLTQKI